jgi:hypothetical protein
MIAVQLAVLPQASRVNVFVDVAMAFFDDSALSTLAR